MMIINFQSISYSFSSSFVEWNAVNVFMSRISLECVCSQRSVLEAHWGSLRCIAHLPLRFPCLDSRCLNTLPWYMSADTCDCVDADWWVWQCGVFRYIEAMCPGAVSVDEIDPNAVPAPKPRRERQRPGAPWFTDEIKKEKVLKRKVWKKLLLWLP